MTMEKDVVRGIRDEKVKHIGNRIKTYRKCKELPIKLFAERVGIGIVDAQDIETGMYAKLDTAVLLKISEVLGISYSDLFERDDGKYYSNVDNRETIEYLFRKAKETKTSLSYIGKTLDVPKSTYHNWLGKKRISSPFDMQNVLSLLKVDADELRAALRSTESVAVRNPATEEVKEKTEPESMQMMNEILKAIKLYRNTDSLIAQLDDIIEKAQKIKKALGGK